MEVVTIEWLSDWAGGIIFAVIIGTRIEMLLPEGNSKKYIKVVIGIYVLFTIVSPIITKFTGESVEVSDILELDKYIEEAEEASKSQNTIQDSNQNSIMSMYESGLKSDIQAKVQGKGYIVNSINISITNDESYTIENITLDLEKDYNFTNNADDTENGDEQNNNENIIEPIESIEKVDISFNNKISESEKNVEDNDSKKNKLSYSEKKDLKEYLSSVYEVNEKNITIN